MNRVVDLVQRDHVSFLPSFGNKILVCLVYSSMCLRLFHPTRMIILKRTRRGTLFSSSNIFFLHPKLLKVFALHLKVRTEYNIFLLLLGYGNVVEFCPSPLLSSLIRGCLETKRDIYNGGANYTLIGVQFITLSNTIDALYAIKKLCFDHDSAVISLSELVRCLKCDWGHNMQEPFQDELAGATRGQRLSETYKEVRERALNLPKFGTSEGAENEDIKKIARQALENAMYYFELYNVCLSFLHLEARILKYHSKRAILSK